MEAKEQAQEDPRITEIKNTCVRYENFPKPGINFIDVFPLVTNQKTLGYVVDIFAERLKDVKYDKVYMLESRGFIFGIPLCQKVNMPIYLSLIHI